MPERQPQDAIQGACTLRVIGISALFLGPSQRGSIDANRKRLMDILQVIDHVLNGVFTNSTSAGSCRILIKRALLLLDAQNRLDPFAPIALDRDQMPLGQLVGGDLLSGVGQLGLEFVPQGLKRGPLFAGKRHALDKTSDTWGQSRISRFRGANDWGRPSSDSDNRRHKVP